VTFTVNLGSPHAIQLSWYVAPPAPSPTPAQNPGGGGGSGGGSRAYVCGDGTCNGIETFCGCEEDCEAPECGDCEEVSCETGEPTCIAVVPCAGDGVCDTEETCESAPEDCGECPVEEPEATPEKTPEPTVEATPEPTVEPVAPGLEITPVEVGRGGPTGLVGLGTAGDAVIGILVLLIIGGTAFYVKVRK